MKILVTGVVCLVVTGCDFGSNAAMDLVAERNFVILASHDISLSETPLELKSSEPMKISGPLSSVCFVLTDGVSLQNTSTLEKVFAGTMRDASINTALQLSDGSRVVLSRPTVSWSEKGIVLKAGELAACAAPACGVALPIGGIVNRIEATAVPRFTVKGIYWKSERDPSEPLMKREPTRSGCSAPK